VFFGIFRLAAQMYFAQLYENEKNTHNYLFSKLLQKV